jgi:regulator of protease activity HflC (stomatin/prohibitin superfamily)
MRKVKVNAYQVGLVFKNGVYQRLLQEGNYWFWRGGKVELFDITKPFTAPVELNILLQDERLAAQLDIIEVRDNEIALQYENGLLKGVVSAGRYAYWKSFVSRSFIVTDISQPVIPGTIDRTLLTKAPLSGWVRNSEVQSFEKALLFVDGKFVQQLEPGTYYWWKNNISIQVGKVDIRQQQLEINGQEILTKDKAALRINAWAQYKVADIEQALLYNKEYDKQLYVAFQLAMREYVAGYAFDELLEKKESIAPFVMDKVKVQAAQLGVQVSDFGIRDIILPGDVKDIMNQVLVAEKKAQANSIMRREETASTRSLLNTARLMEDNAMLWKLKEMEYVEKIADKISNISVGGNGVLLDQLKQIFVPNK